MKKFLALVLALVMTMSLVTISAGAEDFIDDSKITYEEAVDVMSALSSKSLAPALMVTRDMVITRARTSARNFFIGFFLL